MVQFMKKLIKEERIHMQIYYLGHLLWLWALIKYDMLKSWCWTRNKTLWVMFSHISVKVYCHGSSNMLSLPFSLLLANFFAPSRDHLCFQISLKPVFPWESTISTYGLSKILQVSYLVACNKNCSPNMHDLLVRRK